MLRDKCLCAIFSLCNSATISYCGMYLSFHLPMSVEVNVSMPMRLLYNLAIIYYKRLGEKDDDVAG